MYFCWIKNQAEKNIVPCDILLVIRYKAGYTGLAMHGGVGPRKKNEPEKKNEETEQSTAGGDGCNP